MVLMCDFSGSIPPEIGKTRPVVIVTPPHVRRRELATAVPLSTKPPQIAYAYHHRVISSAYPGAAKEVWAKCDLVMSVSYARLHKIRLPSGEYVIGYVSYQDLMSICYGVNAYFGIDPAPFRE